MREDEKIPVFVCGTAFTTDIPDCGNIKVFFSEENIRAIDKCIDSGCGLVECELTFKRWIEMPNIEKMFDSSLSAKEATEQSILVTKAKIEKYQNYLKRLEQDLETVS